MLWGFAALCSACGSNGTAGAPDAPASGGSGVATGGTPGSGGASPGSGGTPNGGGAAGSATATGGGGATGDPCTAFARAYCTEQLACSPVAFHEFWFTSVDGCITDVASTCVLELAAPGTAATADATTRCAEAMSRQTCAEFLLGAPPACLPAGQLADGSACEFSSQCQSTLCDIGENVCGTCKPRVDVGGACMLRGDRRFTTCKAGLLCSATQCRVPSPLGGPCNSQNLSEDCAPPLVCLDGKCAQPIGIAAPCKDRGQCAGDAYCKQLSPGGVCAALEYVAVGAACNVSGPNVCSAGTACKNADGSFSNGDGTCMALAPLGAACTIFDDCALSLCVAGKCENRGPASACQ